MSTCAIIVQARMGSTRLPGKVLMDIGGKPLLEHVVERIAQAKLNLPLLVCTSTNQEDKKIKDWMKKNSLNIDESSRVLGISKRQFSRFLSGETKAKRVHTLAMQMIWILNENKKEIINNNVKNNSKKIQIPIK